MNIDPSLYREDHPVTLRPPFPAVIDATMRSIFTACPQKFYLEHILHNKPKAPNVHLHAGGAYAKGLEIARKSFFEAGEEPDIAMARGMKALIEDYGAFECPEDSPKSLMRMVGALEYYFDRYPLTEETATPSQVGPDRKGVEFSFAEPLPILHPETANPIIYCGRMDQVTDFAGARYGEDDKTTSQLGATWPRQWDLRAQFTGYCWGCQKAGIPISGFLVRGISVLKTKYDTLQALTYRPQFMIDRWFVQVQRDINRMIECWKEGYWDFNLDDSCSAFGGCMFRKVCMSEDPKPWLEIDFEKRRWDPLLRKEFKVDASDQAPDAS